MSGRHRQYYLALDGERLGAALSSIHVSPDIISLNGGTAWIHVGKIVLLLCTYYILDFVYKYSNPTCTWTQYRVQRAVVELTDTVFRIYCTSSCYVLTLPTYMCMYSHKYPGGWMLPLRSQV